jgi:hypothetical protein
MKKFAIIGQQCSGKTSAAGFIASEFESPYILKFAQPIYDVIAALKQPKHRAFMQQFSDLAKSHFGPLIFTDIFCATANELDREMFDVVLCDDMRFQQEVDAARELGFKIISIDAAADIRRNRAMSLGLDFIENHNSETEVPSLIWQADYVIVDHGISMGELRRQCQRAVEVLS